MKGNKEYGWTNLAAEKIAGAGLRLQQQFAKVMNNLVAGIPKRKLKIVVVVFCVVGGGFSLYLVADALFGAQRKKSIQITPMKVPRYVDKTATEVREVEGTVSDDMYRQIQRYKHYMDSMQITIRPGLLDSMKVLEQIYKTQQ